MFQHLSERVSLTSETHNINIVCEKMHRFVSLS